MVGLAREAARSERRALIPVIIAPTESTMPEDDASPPIRFVPEGALGKGTERIFSQLSESFNIRSAKTEDAHASFGESQAGRNGTFERGVEVVPVLRFPKEYSNIVSPRPYGLLAFEMIGIYISSMRIFIQQCLPVRIGGCIDDQIIGALTGDEESDLQKRIAQDCHKSAIYLIDTKHFPIVIGKFWCTFKKHFRKNKKEQRNQLREIHAIRNDVCHPSVGDITKSRARQCFDSIVDVLDCTGPPEAVPMLESIWNQAETRSEQALKDDRTRREMRTILGKMGSTLKGATQLVMDLRENAQKLV